MFFINALTRAYAQNGKATNVFRDTAFDVQPGELVSIFGPSGCGKTKLPRCLAGLALGQGNGLSPLVRRDSAMQPLMGVTAGFGVIQATLPARRLGTDRP